MTRSGPPPWSSDFWCKCDHFGTLSHQTLDLDSLSNVKESYDCNQDAMLAMNSTSFLMISFGCKEFDIPELHFDY